jgi:hypothetical protein
MRLRRLVAAVLFDVFATGFRHGRLPPVREQDLRFQAKGEAIDVRAHIERWGWCIEAAEEKNSALRSSAPLILTALVRRR